MSGFVYTCDRAANKLAEVVRLLGGEGLFPVEPDAGLLRQCVHHCTQCERSRGPSRCEGWDIVVDRDVLSFRPISTPGRPTIRLAVSAACSFRRPQPGRQPDWDERPLASSTVTVEAFDVADDGLLERHHMDLANVGQAGPVWHFQYGGNPAGNVDGLPTSWLKPPRWSMPPMDLTLLLEAISYNFFPVEWERLNERGEWLRLISGAEQLVISHFAGHIMKHFERAAESRDRTWLSAQDNLKSGFDPRPR